MNYLYRDKILITKYKAFKALTIVIILCFSFVHSCFAIEVSGIYEAVVSVSSQDKSERDLAIQIGFIDVLVKASGDRLISGYPAIGEALKNVSNFVRKYQYYNNTGKDSVIAPWEIKIVFDKKAVNQFLLDNEWPIWREDRPEVMVWLALDDDNGRRILGVDDQSDIKTQLNKIAQKRGVRLVLPLMDMDDINKVKYADVWGGFKDEVISASSRYGMNHILIGKIFQQGSGFWSAQWRFLGIDEDTNWESQSENKSETINVGVDGVADIMGEYYALKPGNDGVTPLKFMVSSVNSIEKYASLLKYLKNIVGVTGISINGFNNDVAEIRINVQGHTRLFFDVINSGSIIFADVPINQGAGSLMPKMRVEEKDSKKSDSDTRIKESSGFSKDIHEIEIYYYKMI